MKLRQFEFLCMLKEYGTISRVASEAYTSQPTVSIAIKEMESELGYPLLRRTNRGIQFTRRGQLVLEQAQIIMQAVDRVSHISACDDGALSGCLHVGSLPHLCNTLLQDVQMELQDAYPDFTLVIQNGEPQTLIKMLRRGELDLALVQDCELLDERICSGTEEQDLHFEPLFQDELTFVVAEGHPLLELEHPTLADVREYPFAAFGDIDNRCVITLTHEMGYPMQVRRFYEMIRMRQYMQMRHAVTVLPRRAVVHGNMNYRIKYLPLPLEGLNWTTRVGWLHPGRQLSAAERLVVENLKLQCQKQEYIRYE